MKLIYLDQTYMPGDKGAYPSSLESFRTTKAGLEVFMRPVKISDEPIITPIRHPMARVKTSSTIPTASAKLIKNPLTASRTMSDCQCTRWTSIPIGSNEIIS